METMTPEPNVSRETIAPAPKKRGRKPKATVIQDVPQAVSNSRQGPIMGKNMSDPAGSPVYFGGYVPTPQGQKKLPLRDEYKNNCPVQFAFFRADEMQELNGTPAAKYWAPVSKNGYVDSTRLGDLKFEDIFLASSEGAEIWDERGYYPRGRFVKTDSGRECRESYMAARPAAVFAAEQELRKTLSSQSGDVGTQENATAIQGIGVRDPKTGQVLSAAQPINPASVDPMSRAMVTTSLWSKVGKP